MKKLRAADWPKIVRPGSRVFIGSGASVPVTLVNGMLKAYEQLRDVELVHIHTLGPTPWIKPKYAENLRTNTFFLTPDVGRAVRDGRADYTPCSLSEVPILFRSTVLPLDVALISVSPPDADGNVGLGVSVDVVKEAAESARVVVAQVNSNIPRTHGATTMHVDEIDWFVKRDTVLPEFPRPEIDPVRAKIGAYLAELVDDGSTLQVGLGVTPQSVIGALKDHRHMGIHSGMMSDGLMDLIRSGAVDNSQKHFQNGTAIVSHALGSQELYDFVNENPEISFHPSSWVNDPSIIAMNHRMVAINGARHIDITGQVVRDSAGHQFYGGIGAQLDFLRGAAASSGGLPIYVLPSTNTAQTKSRILADLKPGTGVASSRSDVHYIVTEYGVASLYGRSIRERTLELIQIAHPKFREDLLRGAHERGWLPQFVSLAPTSLLDGDTESGVELKRIRLGKKNQSYFLRPLHASDTRRLQKFFYSHSEETIRTRYGYLREHMPADSAYKLVAVDQSCDLALGIFEETGLGREPVLRSVGRFYRDPDADSAEVAFVVHDETRRIGMASLLLEQLAGIAAKRGVESFWAEVLTNNRSMRQLFEKYGAVSERSEDTEGDVFRMNVKTITQLAVKFSKARKIAKKKAAAVKRRLGWFWSKECLAHDTGADHVETPERYAVLGKALKKAAKAMDVTELRGREITRKELLRVHAAYYLDIVHIDVENLADQLRTGDTPLCLESERVAKLSAGAGLEAVERVMQGEINRAFVAVRPPGHHATVDRGMGFCIYNNVALMARHAQEVHGCERVLIVDWDVHHGNGTQDIFGSDPSVFFFSSHEQGIWPFTGAQEETGGGPGAGTVMNLPLPAGSGIDAILPAITGPLTDAMESFQPQLVLISAGFDSRVDDPIGSFSLTDKDFATLTKSLSKIADRWAGGKMISVLEGGYNPKGLASAAVAHFRAMAE